MFGVLNLKINELVVETGSKLPEEQRPSVRLFIEREHAEEFVKHNLLNLPEFKVVEAKYQII